MRTTGRRFLVARTPDIGGWPACQHNCAFLGGADRWTTRIERSFDLDTSGNPGPGRFTLVVTPPAGREALGFDGPVEDAVGAALFAAAEHKLFFTRYTVDVQWHLDVFRLANDGLVLATGPLTGSVPRWCGREVTADPEFAEDALARAPLPAR